MARPRTAATLALVEPPKEPSQMVLDLGPYGEITETALSITDPDMPFERWDGLGRFFGRVKRASSWWIGDWILFGEGVYGEKYSQAAEETGLDRDTLVNYAYVCRNIPPSARRQGVSFAIHADVAPLEPKEQKRWLDLVEAEGMSRSDLRKALKAERDGEETPAEAGVSDESRISKAEQIEGAARDVWKTAQRDKDSGRYLVEPEPMSRLAAALGED